MRVPADVSKSFNPYYAMRALLTEIINHNNIHHDINSVVMTSFCCGAGKMDPHISAKLMRFAYDCVIENAECSWDNAHRINEILNNINPS